MAKITYENKVALNENPEIADINKVKDTDMNQIKNVVNENETKELIAVSSTAPAECSTGDMYFNTTDNLIYTATATDTWSSTGTTPTENTIYVLIADKVMYMYNGSTLVKLGSADIPQQDTAPVNPKEDDLWIDTDDDSSLIGVKGTTTVSDSDTYSCNYLNQHLYDMYSTNEVLTNKIWIDGRPVYRKVIKYTTPVNANDNPNIPLGIDMTTISDFTKIETIAKQKNINVWFTASTNNSASDRLSHYININSNITIRNSFDLDKIIIIIEYTKLADSGDR